MFTKVLAALIAAGVVCLGALGAWAADYDWSQLGGFGPVIGAALPVLAAYFVKELRGYGSGVPVLDDQIPGGAPLPTGATGLE